MRSRKDQNTNANAIPQWKKLRNALVFTVQQAIYFPIEFVP